jgi:hypothetical protein
MKDALRRMLRTLFQWIVAGGLTAIGVALVEQLQEQPLLIAVVHGALLLITTYAQNWLEDEDKVPAMLYRKATQVSIDTPSVRGTTSNSASDLRGTKRGSNLGKGGRSS